MYSTSSLCTFASVVLLLALSGTPNALAQEPFVPQVKEAWRFEAAPDSNVDSLAACAIADGSIRVFATCKKGDRVDVLDAATGKLIGSFGKTGTGRGELKRPNGIATVDWPKRGTATPPAAIFIVERDNARLQAISPDRLESLGVFAAGKLHKPYGIAVSHRGSDVFLYVTENDVPPEQTVRVFKVELNPEDQKTLRVEHVKDFGDRDGKGAIGKAESIVVDDALDRVLLCDEKPGQKMVKVYTRDGKFTGETFAENLVQGDPEGLTLIKTERDAKNDKGIIILTDQTPTLSTWYAFDRKSFRRVGSFTGSPTIANTDGVAVFTSPIKGFSDSGGFFAVNNDGGVCAYRLGDVFEALKADRQAP